MEKTLEDFLALPDVDNIQEEVFVSKRLGKFKVKAMTSDEHSEYMKRCRGKINKNGTDFDSAKFHLLIVAGQTIYPDFKNAELLKSAKCATPTELIKKKLLAGEIAELAERICEISGFDNDINEEIEEAKN
jgi:hypothetical protein